MKGILFDLDNTLVDWSKMKHKACDAAIEAMIDSGLKMTHKNAKKILFEMYDEHGIENQNIFNKFLEKNHGHVDYRILSNGVAAYRAAKKEHLIPYQNVVETLEIISKRGIKMGIVSDAPRMSAWLRLAEMHLSKYFDVVITLDDSGDFKPNPIGFKKALDELSLEAKDVIFIGDHPDRDVKGAKELGMVTVLAKYGSIFKSNEKADHEIKDISELIRILDGKEANTNKHSLTINIQ
jgi:putative hydrolase of the HAD superfamily